VKGTALFLRFFRQFPHLCAKKLSKKEKEEEERKKEKKTDTSN